MSLIGRYHSFKKDLQGYLEIPFDHFRKRLLPLKAKRVWDEDEIACVKRHLESGAGRALQNLYGAHHPTAVKILGEAPIDFEPFSRVELDSHMSALIKSCKADDWPSHRYRSYLTYLDSTMSPADLEEASRARNHAASLIQDVHVPVVPVSEVERDLFAETYRKAGPAFRRVVEGHLLGAAAEAIIAGGL
ncbi:MAG: hypothetical protein OK454_05395 [Thaumarchaeota archaeon]|nr:hypothetical protein [Nitrososphaerota archaeon]